MLMVRFSLYLNKSHFKRPLKAPTLIIHGDKDPMVSVKLAREIETTLKSNGTKVEYRSIPDGKHNLHFKYHEQFAQWVRDFVGVC